MDTRLYLLEIFVEDVLLGPLGQDVLVGENDSLRIVAQLENFYYLEIRTGFNEFNIATLSTSSALSTVEVPLQQYQLKMGKSALFPAKPSALLAAIAQPLHLETYVNGKSIATASYPWSTSFPQLIGISEKLNEHLPPAKMRGRHNLLNYEGVPVGLITVMVSLTSFGNNIRTAFKLVDNDTTENKPSTNHFYVKYRDWHAVFHVGDKKALAALPIFNVVSLELRSIADPTNNNNPPNQEAPSWYPLYNNQSVSPKPSAMPPPPTTAAGPHQTVATIDPSPSSYIDQDGALSMYSVSIFDRPEERKFMSLSRIDSGGFLDFATANDIDNGEQEIRGDLTVDRIERLLCQCRHCPAAKKFKEFGIGPLATKGGRCLGGLYSNLTAESSGQKYGLSQTYGTMANYGPYGILQSDAENKTVTTCSPPLRLTGGGGHLYMENIKSPMVECQGLLEEVDTIVSNFKKALGPCGEALCPFSPNQIDEKCKVQCSKWKSAPRSTSTGNAQQGCGSPKCVYNKYKASLTEQDAQIERQFLPSSVPGKCKESCPYIASEAAPMPPIHWDCPVALPEGICRNPKCPHLPADIRKLCDLLSKAKQSSICENPECPYAMANKSSEMDSLCENPDCPYAGADQKQQPQVGEEEEPSVGELCGNPQCPYVKAEKQKDPLHCSNTDCPFSMLTESCTSPGCPFVKFMVMFLNAANTMQMQEAATGSKNSQHYRHT